MSTRIRGHLRSNVVGYIALFLVLTGGTAYALDGSNTVFSDDIVNGEVKTGDLANDGVTSAKILNGAVKVGDLGTDAVTSAKITNGQVKVADLGADAVTSNKVAPDTLTAADIRTGAVRSDELATIVHHTATSETIAAGGNGSVTASCGPGEKLISGGNDGFFDVFIIASRQEGSGWAVFGHNASGGNRTITAHAYCLAG